MRRLKRSACPDGLTVAAAAEVAAAQLHLNAHSSLKDFTFGAYRGAAVRAALKQLSGGKCAYCEAEYDDTAPEDIEHYRPKGAIETATGRLQTGYWWLAAEWDNLLPSCIRCNREETQPIYDGSIMKVGKGERFPIDDETKRATAIGGETHEKPLLINPFKEDPSKYIRFEVRSGKCIAVPTNSNPQTLAHRRARASIDIYGLNRQGLVRSRTRYMKRAREAVLRLRDLNLIEQGMQGAVPEAKARVARLIKDELRYLESLTTGEDLFTGMISTLVAPEFAT